MTDELKIRLLAQRIEVCLFACREVVQRQHAQAIGDQAVAQMAAEKTGAAGDHCKLSGWMGGFGGHEWLSAQDSAAE